MPKHKTVDPEVIRALYDETHSQEEVAERLGIHRNTVYKYLRLQSHQCERCFGPGEEGYTYCRACRAVIREYARVRRIQRRQAGLCYYCNEPAVTGASCEKHRVILNNRKTQRRARQMAKDPETVLKRERDGRREAVYGPAANDVWERDHRQCAVCGQPYRPRFIHIHHIDGDHSNRSGVNLICLCSDCHQAVTHLLCHPNLPIILAWIKATYPKVGALLRA